jgi:hypothetical protein
MNPIQLREGMPEDPSPQIGPSLMCADQGNLRQETIDLDRAGVDFFHFDIMDGNFVANLAMSPDMIQALRAATKKPFDVHLMLAKPEPYIGRFASSGADSITIHAEAGGGFGRSRAMHPPSRCEGGRGASMFVAGTFLLFKPGVSFEDTVRMVRACLDSENTE